MEIQIESPHINADEELLKLIQTKMAVLGRRYNRIGKSQVVLRLEENDKSEHYLIQTKIELPQKMLFASSRARRFELALSGIIDELEHQLNHYKEERSPRH